jgi:hypothetical protein
MPHSETFTTRYSADGGVAPRNLTFIGTFPSIDRETFEFQNNGTQTLIVGYDKTAKRHRIWRI